MLITTIQAYLRTHDRLVIPRLGLFLVSKEDRTVVFSELVRRDDGVLRGLLVASGHNELAAAGMIDRFVFEVRQAMDNGERFPLPGLGRFAPGANGTIRFDYAPEQLATPIAPAVAVKPEPVVEEPLGKAPLLEVEEPSHPIESPTEKVHKTTDEEMPQAQHVAPIEEPEEEATQLDDQDQFDEQDESNEESNAREVVDRHPRRGAQPRGVQRKKPDRFVLVALIAVLLALAAIAYGYYCEWDEQQANERMIERIEQARQATDAAQEQPVQAPQQAQ